MERWRSDARVRRRAVFALGLLAHGVLIGVMLGSRTTRERTVGTTTVEATIWLLPPPSPRVVAQPLPPPRPTRLRSMPHPVVDPQAIRAPLLEARPVAQAASAAEPPASAPPPPLNLTLTREQLRDVIAGSRPTLAQSLAKAPAPSALARIGGDDAYEERDLPGGEREVHSHGGCFRLVPTARGQYDPFNHGNEHLTAPCK